jgi:hypothetical protein
MDLVIYSSKTVLCPISLEILSQPLTSEAIDATCFRVAHSRHCLLRGAGTLLFVVWFVPERTGVCYSGAITRT